MHHTLRALAFTGSLVLLSAPPALAADPLPPAWQADAHAAIVHVESVWAWRMGVLVGDGSTVWALAGDKDSDRTVYVSVPDGEEVEAEGYVYHDGRRLVWSLTPTKSLGRRGLEISAQAVEPGQVVYTLEQRHGKPGPIVKVLVASVGPSSFALSAESGELQVGAPVLDADGRLLGLLTTGRRVAPAPRLNDRANLVTRCPSVRPIFGIRGGVELEGTLGDSSVEGSLLAAGADAALLFDIELGVAFWDRLALVASFGIATGADDDAQVALPAEDGLGPGVMTITRGMAYRIGLEARYRQLLSNSAFPIYLDLAAGGLYSSEDHDPVGPTLRSTDPTCDPTSEACPLVVQGQGDIDTDRTVDLRVGLDLRLGLFLVGYRFLPGFGDAERAHQITLGFSAP